MLVMGLVAWAILALFVALAEAGEVKVTVPRQPVLKVIDLFTNKVVARLEAGRRAFDVTLRRNFQGRRYHLRLAGNG